MVAINFERRFTEAVAAGEKRQTIRHPRKSRPIVAGDTLQLYTGLRTKAARKLADAACVEVAEVIIDSHVMRLRGQTLNAHECERFARADGFENYRALRDWFDGKYGLPFHGVAIRWEIADG